MVSSLPRFIIDRLLAVFTHFWVVRNFCDAEEHHVDHALEQLKVCEENMQEGMSVFATGRGTNKQDLLAFCGERGKGPYVKQHSDNTMLVSCSLPAGCLDADVEDMLWDTSYREDSQLYELDILPEMEPSKRMYELAVCVEGRSWTNHEVQLRRLAKALYGFGVEHLVIAVSQVVSNLCFVSEQLHSRVFRGRLARFLCVENPSREKVREAFMSGASNGSWWVQNEHHFDFSKVGDVQTLSDTLRNFQMKSHCLDEVDKLESSLSQEFGWVAYIRCDFDFLAAHPPLSLMRTRYGIWVPDGGDYGGLNDRWAVVLRRYAAIYFRRWSYFSSGASIPAFDLELQRSKRFISGVRTEAIFSPEVHLLLHLRRHGIWPQRVHRFLPTAALRCIPGTSRACEVHSSLGRLGWRHLTEYVHVRSVAYRLHQSWHWAFDYLKLQPDCPSHALSATGPIDCCHISANPRIPIYTEYDCFFDGVVYTHMRCCPKNEPHSVLAIAPDSSLEDPVRCWLLRWSGLPQNGFNWNHMGSNENHAKPRDSICVR